MDFDRAHLGTVLKSWILKRWKTSLCDVSARVVAGGTGWPKHAISTKLRRWNAARTAHSLALGKGEKVGYEHLRLTLDSMDEFTREFEKK